MSEREDLCDRRCPVTMAEIKRRVRRPGVVSPFLQAHDSVRVNATSAPGGVPVM